MTIESVTYISDLDATYPAEGEVGTLHEGNNHIRNIKSAIKTTFPNLSAAMSASASELNYLDGITARTLTDPASPGDQGSVTLPGGVVLKYGYSVSSGTSANNAAITFDAAFASACAVVMATVLGTGSLNDIHVQIGATTAAGAEATVLVDKAITSGVSFAWLAIGY